MCRTLGGEGAVLTAKTNATESCSHTNRQHEVISLDAHDVSPTLDLIGARCTSAGRSYALIIYSLFALLSPVLSAVWKYAASQRGK